MPESQLPFNKKRLEPRYWRRRKSVLAQFPAQLQALAREKWYLRAYLQALPIEMIGPPQYAPQLTRSMQKMERRNLIYPVQGNLLVHVYPDLTDERDFYIPIEPNLVVGLDDVVEKVDAKLLDWAEEIGQAATPNREKVFMRALNKICTLRPGVDNGQIHMTPLTFQALRYQVLRDKLRMGSLQPLIYDPYIEDISCSGVGNVFVEHKIFKSLKSSISFASHDELDDFVVWLGERIGRPVTLRHPIVDAVLPDGSRINMVYGRDIAKRGSNFTIRKFSEEPLSILNLIDFGTLDYLTAAYLWLVIEEGLNVFVAGATASGKTTTLNALTTFVPSDGKIVSIEDTPELQMPHENWVREVVRETSRSEGHSAVGMFDLLKAALRQRPDRIMIGEIRGAEGNIAFQAMQTGHGVMSTFHAASVQKLIQRLTGEPINVPKPYVDNLDLVVIQAAVRGLDGQLVRRVVSVNEIVDYNPVDHTYSFITAFRWKPEDDTFEFSGDMNSFVLEDKIAMRRGLPEAQRRHIYTELRRRARVLERIHKNAGITGFQRLFDIVSEGRKRGAI
jgi:flagellar protein FlaI